jgi:hypothetical protein
MQVLWQAHEDRLESLNAEQVIETRMERDASGG